LSEVFIRGWGAVSPAGWGTAALRDAVTKADPIAVRELPRPNASPIKAKGVPPLSARPVFLAHPRLRRTSPISQFAVAAALEALGSDATEVQAGTRTLGVVFCSTCGCVNYSKRFFGELLADPSTASPVVFPETVFNAPSSHLAALLGTKAINYTIVGDPGTFLVGLSVAADWLVQGRVQSCLVIAAEELDWLTASAQEIFDSKIPLAEGAGAINLSLQPRTSPSPKLVSITNSRLFDSTKSKSAAARSVRKELGDGPVEEALWDSLVGSRRSDLPESEAWNDWRGPRFSAKRTQGEGLTAAAAWQCVLAAESLSRKEHPSAAVSVVGCNQQAIAARFGFNT